MITELPMDRRAAEGTNWGCSCAGSSATDRGCRPAPERRPIVEDALEVIEEAAEKKNPLNAWVAIAVVVLASFMAISAVKGDNLAQAMAKAKAEEVNAWN